MSNPQQQYLELVRQYDEAVRNYRIDRDYWNKFSFDEQMGNIGSEVGRALAAKRRGDQERLRGALYRGLDLFDATAELWATKKQSRMKTILHDRERFLESITTDKEDPTLEDYFMQFALAARRDR